MTRKSLIYASFSLHFRCGRKGCNVVDRKLKASRWVLAALVACVAGLSQPQLAEAKSTPREAKAQVAKKGKSAKVAKASSSKSTPRQRKVSAARKDDARSASSRVSSKRVASAPRVSRADDVPA